MRRILLSAAVLTAMWPGTAAFAQAVIEIAPEQRTIIREHIVRQKPRAVTIQGDVRVGAPLPQDVELLAVPSEWGPQFSRYRYVYWNNRVVLVNPSDRQVVHVID
jgi:Protein of unknown function (DUF1236)